MTGKFATAARVRDGLERASGVDLVFSSGGGVKRWASGDFEFRLGDEIRLGLRPKSATIESTIRECRVALGKFCWVNVCVAIWREEVAAQVATPILPNLRRASEVVCHLSVERINYADARRPAVHGLSSDDIGDIAAFIRRPLEEFLQYTIDEAQSHIGGRYERPVTGKLHWNWRSPTPEITKFHEISAEFTSTFTPERVTTLPFDNYVRENEYAAGMYFRAKDQPDARIFIPPVNRDDPEFYLCEVELGELKVPLRLQLLTHANLEELGLSVATPLPILSVYIIKHPFSLLLTPKKKPPTGLTLSAADCAVEHLRTVWLIPKPSNYFSDVLTI